jgi:hypothetical protein
MCLPPRTDAFLITPLDEDSHGMRALLLKVVIPAALKKIPREHEIIARMNSGALSSVKESSLDWRDGD